MWTSVPAHIDPYPSKARLLLETSGGINELCLQWVPCIPGTTAQDVPLLGDGTYRKAIQEGLMYALIMMVPGRREPALPSVAWRPTGQTGNLVAQHT